MKFIQRNLQKGYTLFELLISLFALIVIPLTLFWVWVVIKLVLAAVGVMEAHS
jgi:type II secretory pathway component PulJ